MIPDDLKGRQGTPYRFIVEEGKVAEFARAVHATDPLHVDRSAAADAGLSGVLTTPTFSVSSAHWVVPGAVPDLGLDLRRVLAGGGEWEYLAPVVAGDELEVLVRVADVTRKESSRGPMTVIALESVFSRDGEVVQKYVSTILQFDPKDAADEH